MKINRLHILFFFTFLICNGLHAQKRVEAIASDDPIFRVEKKSRLPQKIKTREQLETYLPYFVHYYQSIGYYTFSVDTVIEEESKFIVSLFKGKNYADFEIAVSDEEQWLIHQANATQYIKNGTLFFRDYPALTSKVIQYYENNGFPFIEVSLDSTQFEKEKIEAQLRISRKQFITFDSIIIRGNAKLAPSYLYPYLGLKRKKPYNESIMKQIPLRIAELPYVTETRESGIEFTDDKAHLYLFLDKVMTNQFDGYIGLVPVNEKTGKISIAGELNLGLKNVFSLGESINLHWHSPGRYSQYLNIGANFPYLFWTPFGVDASFILEKTDTSYMNMNYVIGLQYSFRGNNYIKTYFDYTTSNILSPQLLVITNDQFAFLDYKKRLYGLEIAIRKLDYLYNPRKGFSLLLNGAVGKINVVKNNQVEAELYNDIKMKSLRYRLTGEVKGFIPLHKRWTIVLGANGGILFGEQSVGNEMFKIGGIKTLRGFNENEIEASSYLIGLGELRFLFARKSYINAFFNVAWYEKQVPGSFITDIPFGFGIGVAFDTKAGIFNLSYALGKQLGNPISFKAGKIHFGIALNF